eukprot:COSAG06_NODE_43964_length_367_cov_0.962687_1_plen_21_part_10
MHRHAEIYSYAIHTDMHDLSP